MDLAHAVCAGFKDRPENCKHSEVKEMFSNEDDWDIPEYGSTIEDSLLLIGLIVVGLNALLLAFCKWRQNAGDDKAVVEMEVNHAVQNYFALRGEDVNLTR